MVLTKSELIASLQNEVRILLHLAGKIEPQMIDYRPTPKQRSTIELLKYLVVMGPALVKACKAGTFDPAVWMEADKVAQALDFKGTLAALGEQSAIYASLLEGMSEADLRGGIDMFGNKTTRGKFLVNSVLCGCAAYRTQLFMYLKACGREELNTMNLWAGIDAPMATT